MHQLAAARATDTAFSVPMLQVLLVDDSEFDRTRIRRLSEDISIPMLLTEASSFAQMQDLISGQRFDLILIDYHLGEADGLQVIRLLKDTPLQRNAGTIMITGNERVEVATSAFRDGCDDFIAKSAITAPVFEETVERVLAKMQDRDAQSSRSQQLHAEIRGAIVASLKGEEAQMMIVDAIKSARPASAPMPFAMPGGFQHVIAVEEDDEFRFV